MWLYELKLSFIYVWAPFIILIMVGWEAPAPAPRSPTPVIG